MQLARALCFLVCVMCVAVASAGAVEATQKKPVADEASLPAAASSQETRQENRQKPSRSGEKPQAPLMPTEEQMAVLRQKMEENPKNLDIYFRYAKLTTALGKIDEAEKAYRHMLEVNPSLGRVKLDLALLYVKTERFQEGKGLLEEVSREDKLPEQVKQNIAQLMKVIDNGLKKHLINGTVMLGFNHDSNANSASSSDATTFNDVSIPLEENSLKHADGQQIAVGLLKHTYRFDTGSPDFKANFATTGTVYRTYQSSLKTLELFLASIKLGPEFDFRQYKTKVGLSFSQNYIELDSYKFMTTPSGELTVNYMLTPKLSLQGSGGYEYRKFFNSPSSATHVNRTGNAWQTKLGATYAVTPKDLVGLTYQYRNEMARKMYNADHQRNLAASYTHQFPNGITTAASAGIKLSNYKAPDPTVSATRIRKSRERSVGFNVSKPLPHNMAIILGYQYKNAESNIENFDYTDHKYTSAVSWSF